MSSLTVKGNWNIAKGKLKQKLAQLTDDDSRFAKGKEEASAGLHGSVQPDEGQRVVRPFPEGGSIGVDGSAVSGRISYRLDSLDDAVFRAMNDVDFPVHRVLRGIDAAIAAGFLENLF